MRSPKFCTFLFTSRFPFDSNLFFSFFSRTRLSDSSSFLLAVSLSLPRCLAVSLSRCLAVSRLSPLLPVSTFFLCCLVVSLSHRLLRLSPRLAPDFSPFFRLLFSFLPSPLFLICFACCGEKCWNPLKKLKKNFRTLVIPPLLFRGHPIDDRGFFSFFRWLHQDSNLRLVPERLNDLTDYGRTRKTVLI